MTKSELNPKYIVLGIMDAYIGYRTSFDEYIEGFYPSERELADKFKDYLSRAYSVDEEKITIEGNSHTSVKCKEIASNLRMCFFELGKHMHMYSESFQQAAYMKPKKDLLKEMSYEDKVSFLYGAFLRNGKIEEDKVIFSLANNGEKIAIIKDILLGSFSKNYGTVYESHASGIPMINSIWIERKNAEELIDLFKE